MQIELFGPSKNLLVKVVQLQRWSSLTFRSGPAESYSSIFRIFLFPVQFRVTTTSQMVDDGSVRDFRTAELSTLPMHGRVG